MSLHYLLDGYNVLNQMPRRTSVRLEDQRAALANFLEVNRPQGSVNNAVTVVFDGKPGVFSPSLSSSSIKIIFSQNESADDKIKAIVAKASCRKNIVVVTDDRDIQYAVRALGAQVCGVGQFCGTREPKGGRRHNQGSQNVEEGKRISYQAEAKINTEFMDIWLRRKFKGKA